MMAIMFAVGVWVFPQLPARIPTHWNAMGQIDGWAAKSLTSVFAEPLMALGFYVLFMVMPYLDPKRYNVIKSKGVYVLVLNLVTALILLMYIGGLTAAFDRSLPMDRLSLVGIGLMLVVLGNYMGRVKSNWTLGVRSAWTLSDDRVWLKANRLGGRLFMLAGALTIVGAALPAPWGTGILLTAMALILPITYVYSLRTYRKLHPVQAESISLRDELPDSSDISL